MKKVVKLSGQWSSPSDEEKVFKSDNGQIHGKYDKTKEYWVLNFLGEDGRAVKEELIKLVNNDSNEADLVLERILYWKGKFNDLKNLLSEFMKLEGTWYKKMFESYGVTINCEHDKENERWKLIFHGTNGSKEEENLNELLQWQLLETKLQNERLRPHDVMGDGACFFRAVSHQIYRTEEHHHEIRTAGIDRIRRFPDYYAKFMNEKESVNDYIERMSENTEPCDNIIMQAVANEKNLVIRVIQPNNDYILNPVDGNEPEEILVGYINDNHYVSFER